MKNTFAKPAAAAMRRLLRRFIGGAEEGTGGIAAVELAIIAPILVLMMVATADFGMGFYRKMQVYDAAQAGAQWAMANGFNSTKISTAVTNATSFVPPLYSKGITATPASCQFCGCTSPGATTVVCPGFDPVAGITTTEPPDKAPVCSSKCPDGTVAGTYVAVSAKATYTTMLSYHTTTLLYSPGIPDSFDFAAQTTVRIQ